jgi:hypothetical protein
MWGKITGGSDSDEGLEISGPTDVIHQSSIKFDTKKGAFDVKNIPPEWKALFKKAGVEKKHLLDNEYAPMIMEVVLNAFNDQEKAETLSGINSNPSSQTRSEPPPLNSGGGGPPAPVLNMGGAGGSGGGPPAPVLNLGGGGGGPAAPVLNLGGGGGGPPAPVLNLGGGGGGPKAPVLNLGGGGGGPAAPVLNLGGGGGGPAAPALNLGGGGGGPAAPVLNLAGGPSAPSLNLAGPSNFKPAANANTGAAKGPAKSANLPAVWIILFIFFLIITYLFSSFFSHLPIEVICWLRSTAEALGLKKCRRMRRRTLLQWISKTCPRRWRKALPILWLLLLLRGESSWWKIIIRKKKPVIGVIKLGSFRNCPIYLP